MEESMMSLPQLRDRMPGKTACVIRKTEVRLVDRGELLFGLRDEALYVGFDGDVRLDGEGPSSEG
jgi:hypothetical protein